MKKQRGSESIRVVMVHQYDPTLETQVGGVEVFVNTFVKYAPEDIEVRMVGVTSDARAHPVGHWQPITLGGRRTQFLPLVAAQPEDFQSKTQSKATFKVHAVSLPCHVRDDKPALPNFREHAENNVT